MNEIGNLNAHYTSSSKVERPNRIAASAPAALPSVKMFNNIDADKKMKAINNDIYHGSKREKNSSVKNFIKWFGAFVLLVLGICGVKKLFRKS